MILQSQKPEGADNQLIREYYLIRIEAGNGQKEIPVIDDCCYDFVLFQEARAGFYYGPGRHHLPISQQLFTIHDLDPPFKIAFTDSLTFFTVKVQPWANRHFFGWLSEKGIADIAPRYPDLVPTHQMLPNAVSLQELIARTMPVLLREAPAFTHSMQTAKALCERIHEQQGVVSVQELCEGFGKSRQYLNKLFKQEVMYSLKKYITTTRILSLVKFKAKNEEVSLTEVCYQYGYFDQSHFIYDFKKVCGVTPKRFFGNLPEFMLRHNV